MKNRNRQMMGACSRYMMFRTHQLRGGVFKICGEPEPPHEGVFKIDGESESPNEGACLTCIRSRNRQKRMACV